MLFIEIDSTVETLFTYICYAGKFGITQTVINQFYFSFVWRDHEWPCKRDQFKRFKIHVRFLGQLFIQKLANYQNCVRFQFQSRRTDRNFTVWSLAFPAASRWIFHWVQQILRFITAAYDIFICTTGLWIMNYLKCTNERKRFFNCTNGRIFSQKHRCISFCMMRLCVLMKWIIQRSFVRRFCSLESSKKHTGFKFTLLELFAPLL